MSDERAGAGALAGLRVLDLSDGLAAYASRLLGDLGAEVIRVEPPTGSRLRSQGPLIDGSSGRGVSAFEKFVNAGKKSVTLNVEADDGRRLLLQLIEQSDVLIETFPPEWAEGVGLSPAAIGRRNPRLVHVSVTPFGRGLGPGVVDVDLTILAAGGLLHLGGYRDAEPVAAYGGQSRFAASLFAATAALVGVLDRERTGAGTWVDVSAQECVAQALEDSVATFDLTGHVRERLGSEPREAGSGIYRCADGYVAMVAGRLGTARAWQALVSWLNEDGVDGAHELSDEWWAELPNRQSERGIARFGEVFGAFAGQRSRASLYMEAQRRGIALSPVNDVPGVLADPQLEAREFWVSVHDPELGQPLTYPGPPYRLSLTPARRALPAPRPGEHNGEVLCGRLGLSQAQYEQLVESGAS